MGLNLSQAVAYLLISLFSSTSFATGTEEMRDFFYNAQEVLHAENTLKEKIPEANCETARALLDDYMAVIEKYQDNPNTLFSGKAYFSDQSIYQVRLAHIARRQGQEAEASFHEAEAVSWCKKAGWSSCELSAIQRVVTEMNRDIKGRCF